ncbi:post-GPI attachment to proteins factor 3 [Nematocida sp. AWRm77]|nr:post-GPI attachment to proteins factor 3 [Nematocida sp. AWRm77]
MERAGEYLCGWSALDRALWGEADLNRTRRFVQVCLQSGDVCTKHSGKYAFIRVLHCQEPFSSVFSFLSACASIRCYLKAKHLMRKWQDFSKAQTQAQQEEEIQAQTQEEIQTQAQAQEETQAQAQEETQKERVDKRKRMGKRKRMDGKKEKEKGRKTSMETRCLFIQWVFLLQSITWTCSAVFHFRDCYLTQCLDYLCAMGSILSMLCVSCMNNQKHFRASVLGGAFLFVFHAYYMLCVEFNFQYNSAVCAALLGANTLLWGVWYKRVKAQAYSRVLKMGGCGLVCASVFQAVDFGPVLFFLDSHSVWHLLGFVYSAVLYEFFLLDTEYEGEIAEQGD